MASWPPSKPSRAVSNSSAASAQRWSAASGSPGGGAALARIQHPNIAPLIGAGIMADGTPWFAMELVEGELLDFFRDTRPLPIPDRLAHFAQVCPRQISRLLGVESNGISIFAGAARWWLAPH